MRNKPRVLIILLAFLILASGLHPAAMASTQVPQTAMLGSAVTKYADPMPVFGPGTNGVDPAGAHPRVPGANVTVTYGELQQRVLPAASYPPAFAAGTNVWGYGVTDGTVTGPNNFPGYTMEVVRGTAKTVNYVNNLGNPPLLQQYLTVDQTIHWANPLNQAMSMMPYAGPPPVVTHLHGAEVPSAFDGGPNQWFTPNGLRGSGYRSFTPAAANAAIYNYPDTQEATTLWYHDHALGITRLNVYAGLAGFYLLRDQFDTGLTTNPLTLPGGPYEMEIVIQDRQFDTNGQWLFPDGSPAGLNGPPPNPTVHPFWNPEFFGDVIVVNGKSWPYLQVEPRRYRFRLLNGSNARFYELRLEKQLPLPVAAGPPIYVIGTDGGLLDKPVVTSSTPTDRLLIGPGERYDVIVDFTAFNGLTLTLANSANGPFPAGPIIPDPATTANIMQFRVVQPLQGTDTSFNPALLPTPTLRGGASQPPALVRLSDGLGGIAPGVTVNKKRQLVLREITGPGGPLEVLINNTKWSGLRAGTTTPVPGSQKVNSEWYTEFPQVGSTEEWEIINLTADAHPIHLHLIQFQAVNRESFDLVGYTAAYGAVFPGGIAIDAYGPPLNYNSTGTLGNPNYTGAYGGNPNVTPFLTVGTLTAPLPQEVGWKDTIIMYPGQVTRIIARWAPTDVAVAGVSAGKNLFPFDSTKGPGYVWHCHILDHEDNEMMRPYIPTNNPNNAPARPPTWGYKLLGIL